MPQLDYVLANLRIWLEHLFLLGVHLFGHVESFFRSLLAQSGVPYDWHPTVMLVFDVLLVLVVLRLFGGLLRLVLTVVLVLLLLHLASGSL